MRGIIKRALDSIPFIIIVSHLNSLIFHMFRSEYYDEVKHKIDRANIAPFFLHEIAEGSVIEFNPEN